MTRQLGVRASFFLSHNRFPTNQALESDPSLSALEERSGEDEREISCVGVI